MILKHYYVNNKHKELPHIVKFSGGRSSGALLLNMLENYMLNASRGDVIIFNNTSAEHLKTYEFVIKVKHICEEKYNIPFFLTEFQTYEDSKNGTYARFGSYRLVNDKPYSINNPNGYHMNGEVFEELISWQGYLPSLMRGRTCTKKMKMDVTYDFLNDWLMNVDNKIPRLGHYGKSSRVNIDKLYEKHIKKGGAVPKHIFSMKREFSLSRPLVREEQSFQDYTKVKLNNFTKVLSKNDIEYCSFIGFRFDEPLRLDRMRKRIGLEENYKYDCAYIKDDREHVYAPMVEFNIEQKDIKEFWDNEVFDLGLPYDGSLGNCVYCFMKGANKLSNIDSDFTSMSPANIDWWINIEKKYQRDLIAEKRDTTTKEKNPFINFFGINGKLSYEIIKNRENSEDIENSLPCNCTD